MRRCWALLQWLWTWSLLLTLPLACITVLWAANTYARWYTFGVRHPTPENFSLARVGAMEAHHIALSAGALTRRMSLEASIRKSGLRTVQLFISQASLDDLESALPDSGFKYQKAQLLHHGRMRTVKARFRGDSAYHWGYWKKSWRIKTDRNTLYEGMRKFNLIAPRTPELLNNHLGHRLAARMGLIAPKSEVVLGSVNGEFAGIYIQTEQMEESTLRRAGRMPGDLYSGDNAARAAYSGIVAMLFEHPGSWEKRAINNHFDDDATAPLQQLLRLISEPESAESQAELSTLLNMEAFGRFSAFESLAGTVHYDVSHNWRLYYDPWRTRFEPAVWDPVAWARGWRPRPGKRFRADVISSPLHRALFLNGDFLRARERAFVRFFADGTAAAFEEEVHQTIRQLAPILQHDPDIAYRVRLCEPAAVGRALQELHDHIVDFFATQRQVHLGTPESTVRVAPVATRTGWGLQVRGRRQIERLEFTLDQKIIGPIDCTVRWRSNGTVAHSNVGGLLSISGSKIRLDAGLLPRMTPITPSMRAPEAPDNYLDIGFGFYEVEMTGLPPDAKLLGVRAGTVSGPLTTGEIVEHLDETDMGPMRQLVPPHPSTPTAVWSGDILLDGDMTTADLLIEPGTVIRCKPGATISVNGRLTAIGTAKQPIRFVPAAENQDPWGVFALRGEGARGSRLSHCHFRGGSGWRAPLFEYTAMVSIHDVDDVAFKACEFESNHLVDDMVHGVYSTITFADCIFRNARADALDMDISRLTMTNCRFIDSGDDGVDLMTTEAAITHTTFQGSGDKGISVGESSKLLLIQSTIENCHIGVEVKDESLVLFTNVDFTHNQKSAFHAYKKNWRYDGGGHARLTNCWFEGPAKSMDIDKHSTAAIDNSFFGPQTPPPTQERIRVGSDITTGQPTQEARVTRSRPLTQTLADWGMTGRLFSEHISKIDPKARGRSQ